MLFSIIFLLMGTVGLTGCSSDDNDNKEFVEMWVKSVIRKRNEIQQ